MKDKHENNSRRLYPRLLHTFLAVAVLATCAYLAYGEFQRQQAMKPVYEGLSRVFATSTPRPTKTPTPLVCERDFSGSKHMWTRITQPVYRYDESANVLKRTENTLSAHDEIRVSHRCKGRVLETSGAVSHGELYKIYHPYEGYVYVGHFR